MLDANEDNFSSQFPMDPYNLRLEYGLSQSHYPHRFVSAVVYDLPWGPGRKWMQKGIGSWLFGGWQLSNILTLQSGDQVWITQAANTAQTFSRQFRPNLVRDAVLPQDQRSLDQWFDRAAFQAPPARAFGNSPKFPGIEGPGLASIDASLVRFIPVPFREGMRFELRGDFFNAINRVNFSAPSGTLGTPTFGRITGARLPRTIQLGAKFWF